MKENKGTHMEESQENPKEEIEDLSQYTLKFDKPWTFEEQTYTELNFDFNKCNGRKMIAIAKRLNLNDVQTPVKALSIDFQAALCAEAAGVSSNLILELPGNYFAKVTLMASSFLLN